MLERRAQGFSLIEILIGLVIGLIGCVIIFQVFAVNEGYKRSSTSGSDAQVAGTLALYALEREMKMGGFGINDRVTIGCNMLGYTSTRSPTNYNLALVPVQIHPGATASASDAISINYGTAVEFAPGYGLTTANMAPGNNFRMENRGGVRFFDFLIVSQPNQANCSLVNAVNLPLGTPSGGGAAAAPLCGGNNSTDAVEICSVSKTDADGVARNYNPAGGLGGAPTYTVSTGTTNTRFFDLGAEPAFNVFRIINNTLSLCNMRTANCADATVAANWLPIMENVVFMKAEYGMDTNDDGIVDTFSSRVCRDTDSAYTTALNDNFGDSWASASDGNADGLVDTWAPGAPSSYDWSRIMAIRVAIVVRGMQYEREDVSPATIQLWPDATGNSGCVNSALLTAAPSSGPVYTVPDRKYRYRVFETIVPLRNSIWMPD